MMEGIMKMTGGTHMTLFGKTAAAIGGVLLTLCLLSPRVLAMPSFAAGEHYQQNKTSKVFAQAASGKEAAPAPKPEPSAPPAMKETMKAHFEEMRKSVAALREDEKKLEGLTDPVEFRKAAIGHFRMLDDLQESHLKHMESMMERMHKGGGPMGHDHSCPKGKDCPCHK